MKESEHLRAAKALIDSPEKWTKGASARDAEGNTVSLLSEDACSYCSMGALSVASHFGDSRAKRYLLQTIPSRLVVSYNDDPSRTHEEVMRMFDKAIEIAESEGN